MNIGVSLLSLSLSLFANRSHSDFHAFLNSFIRLCVSLWLCPFPCLVLHKPAFIFMLKPTMPIPVMFPVPCYSCIVWHKFCIFSHFLLLGHLNACKNDVRSISLLFLIYIITHSLSFCGFSFSFALQNLTFLFARVPSSSPILHSHKDKAKTVCVSVQFQREMYNNFAAEAILKAYVGDILISIPTWVCYMY